MVYTILGKDSQKFIGNSGKSHIKSTDFGTGISQVGQISFEDYSQWLIQKLKLWANEDLFMWGGRKRRVRTAV